MTLDSLLSAARGAKRTLPSLTVLAFAGLALFGLLEIVGPCVWDPVELDLAELAREHQSPPQELGFAAHAVSAAFGVLGVSAWAGRLPMLVLSLVGAYAAFAFARRFGAKGASYFVLLVLATAPAYVLPSRMIGGQIVPVAMSLVTFATLATATFAHDVTRTRRGALVVIALLGAVVTTSARGAFVGVGVPALAVGGAALLHARSAVRGTVGDAVTRALRARGVWLLATALVVGVASLVVALFSHGSQGAAAMLLGPEHVAHKTPSFEAAWTALGTSLFPWSAVLPLSLAALSRRAQRGIESGPRTALVSWVVLAFVAHGALAQRDESSPFVALGGLGLALGMSLAELDTRVLLPWSGRVLSWLTLAVVAYLTCDEVTRAPAKALVAVTTHPLPAFGAAMEKDVTSAFRLAAIVLVGLAMTPVLFTAIADLAEFPPLRTLLRARVSTSFIGVLRSSAERPGTFLLAGGLLAGIALRAGLYPRMLHAFAPDTALSVFAAKARPGEKLGLFGVSQRTLAYVHDTPTSTVKIDRATEAVSLLTPVSIPEGAEAGAGPAPRDFVALTRKDLPAVNALYRKEHHRNLPILGERRTTTTDESILLATSTLLPGETNANPIASFLFDEAPAMQRPLDVDFDGKLRARGWEIATEDGTKVSHVPPRSTFHLKIALGVDQAPGAGYCTFIHLEHSPTRMTAEHKDFAIYPMGLWREGDVVMDDFEIKLGPQFGVGRYTVYYGVGLLPCEDDKRLSVKRGPNDGHDRVRMGDVEVR